MMTRVRSMAIPKERISEKFVMKLSDKSITLSVIIDIKKASGMDKDAMRDSLRPTKKKIQIYTRIMV